MPAVVARSNGSPLPSVPRPAGPYFVALGTIEPRKNHLLLLNIWRELAQEKKDIHLVIIGRRGWENENIIDMLERCRPIQHLVHEYTGLQDMEVTALLLGSKGLLFPSFVEGLGIPALEAAALGIPLILSDIPAFRELNLNAPLIHPLDGLEWKRQVTALAVD
ncbi:glycosyltransferase [Rhizobium deserti]